jgi:hypothetical protein
MAQIADLPCRFVSVLKEQHDKSMTFLPTLFRLLAIERSGRFKPRGSSLPASS